MPLRENEGRSLQDPEPYKSCFGCEKRGLLNRRLSPPILTVTKTSSFCDVINDVIDAPGLMVRGPFFSLKRDFGLCLSFSGSRGLVFQRQKSRPKCRVVPTRAQVFEESELLFVS